MGDTYTATTKAAEAPDIEAGMCDARYDGIEKKRIKGGQYTKDTVNGDWRLEWGFTLLDDDGAVLYDEGEPIELTKLTGMGFNTQSKTVPAELRCLKALCSPTEYQAFCEESLSFNGEALLDATTKEVVATLLGRIVQVEVIIKDSGWPGIANVIAPRSKRKGKAKPVEVDEEGD